jgi:hypothetical protein
VLDSRSIPNNYCLSTTFSSAFSEHTFSITNVYAPSDHRDSHLFLASLSTGGRFQSCPLSVRQEHGCHSSQPSMTKLTRWPS